MGIFMIINLPASIVKDTISAQSFMPYLDALYVYLNKRCTECSITEMLLNYYT